MLSKLFQYTAVNLRYDLHMNKQFSTRVQKIISNRSALKLVPKFSELHFAGEHEASQNIIDMRHRK